jgi:hypothetical protein
MRTLGRKKIGTVATQEVWKSMFVFCEEFRYRYLFL